MPKALFPFACCFFLYQPCEAQLSLSQFFYEQASGDITSLVSCDSSGYVPKQKGANQLWDFSSCTNSGLNTPITNTFVIPAAVPESSLFPGTTLVEIDNGNVKRFYKSSNAPSQMEYIGAYYPSVVHTFTNTWLIRKWPFSFGDTFTDQWSGTITKSNNNGTVAGSSTLTASGHGMLILPGGALYSNVLQIIQMDDYVMSLQSGSLSLTLVQYTYYHSSNKYPLLTVNYIEERADIYIHQSVAVGLTDYNFDATFAIYPNPAKTSFNINLSNAKSESVQMEIYNSTGQSVKKIDLGNSEFIENSILINTLSPGIYMAKTTVGQKTSTRKLIVE